MNFRDLSTESIAPSDSISNSNTIPVTSNLIQEPPKPTSNRTSICWNFFYYPTDPTAKTLSCYYCKAKIAFNIKTSSNLTNHAKTHKRKYAEFEGKSSERKKGTIQKDITIKETPRYDVDKSHEFFLQWIISDSQAFRAGENPFFKEFIKSLHFDYNALKKDAVSQRVMKLFEAVKVKVTELLAKQLGKFSITLDVWTSPSQDPFLCVTLHFIDSDWSLKCQVLAFRYIPGKHSGSNMAVVLSDILKEYRLENRILTATMDNASNNDTLIQELINMGIICDAEHQIRCFSHVVNLAAQACVYEFDDKLLNLRKILTSLKYSPLKLDRLQEKCNNLSKPYYKIILDVKTRWNSTYEMVVRALELKLPLSLLLDEICQENNDFPLLDNSDWEFFTELSSLLKPFKEVTEIISGQHYATFNTVLPLYNVLMDHCTDSNSQYTRWKEGSERERSPYRTITRNSDILPDLITATAAANSKFEKYYDIQSDYAIAALVLDPRLNISYYDDGNKANNSLETQRESAKVEVMHYFNKFYKPTAESIQSAPSNSSPQPSSSVRGSIYKKRKLTAQDGQCCEVTF